jgi:hypothetical protein
MPATEINDNGEIVERAPVTRFSRYPLPPPTGHYQPGFNHFSQYVIPSPDNGRSTAYSRATTLAKVLDDTYNLQRWAQRQLAAAVLEGVKVQMAMQDPKSEFASDHEKAIDRAMGELWAIDRNSTRFNDQLDFVNQIQGSDDATEFGTAVHAWCEALDIGVVRTCDVPDVFLAHVQSYRQLLRSHALYPVPEYTERIVFNESIVGTLDRLFMVLDTGDLVLGDVKTTKSESLGFVILNFCVQLAIYRYATKMLAIDGSKWEDMPALAGDTAYVIHLPNDDHRKSSCIAVSTKVGSDALKLTMQVKEMRKRAKREGFTGVIPVPTPEAVSWMDARHEIQDITDPEELKGIWERYQSVWTPALTELGQQVAALITDEVTEGELVR